MNKWYIKFPVVGGVWIAIVLICYQGFPELSGNTGLLIWILWILLTHDYDDRFKDD